MERERPVEIGTFPESKVRALGFDPSHLTPEEQVELLDLYAVWPDEALAEGAEEEVIFW